MTLDCHVWTGRGYGSTIVRVEIDFLLITRQLIENLCLYYNEFLIHHKNISMMMIKKSFSEKMLYSGSLHNLGDGQYSCPVSSTSKG